MRLDLSDLEVGMCLAALGSAIFTLESGRDATIRMNQDVPPTIKETIHSMIVLEAKIRKACLLPE